MVTETSTRVTAGLVALTVRQRLALLAPPALIGSMLWMFSRLTQGFGMPTGYLLAFFVYWLGWCLVVPLTVLGPRALQPAISSRPPRKGASALVWWPLVFPLCFSFLPRLWSITLPVLGWSIALGIVTGVSEEVFWRGMFLRLFPSNDWLAIVYPSLLFGLWHLCPLGVRPSHYPGGTFTFVAYSTVLGASYAAYARRSQSLFWVIVSHSVHDSLGLGALAYAGGFR